MPPTPPRRAKALDAAEMVVALSPFKSRPRIRRRAAARSRRSPRPRARFVNAEGRVQSFHGVVKPLGETRPAWKVLRVLGNLLGLPGFDQDSSEEVRAEALGDVDITARLSNATAAAPQAGAKGERRSSASADLPIYATDALVRRSHVAAADRRWPRSRQCRPADGAVATARPGRRRPRPCRRRTAAPPAARASRSRPAATAWPACPPACRKPPRWVRFRHADAEKV